ncbi:MAG: asparaginase [Anaerolineales bacterium]|nr:asparaginase [Anaerolineales bacterium]
MEPFLSSAYQPVLHVGRGPIVESVHAGAVVVADREGVVRVWWGDPEVVTYSRSSAKPFQAVPLIESGGKEFFDLSPEEIAVTCASHSGTDRHVAVLRRYQEKIGVSEKDLLCGTHLPIDRTTAEHLIREGISPTPIRHNCSGKHTGMLALARLKGLPLSDYTDKDHPVQQLILNTFAEICGYPKDQIRIGIDGCSVPVYAIPLRYFARAYARLVDPVEFFPSRADALRLIGGAMSTHPFMVAGPDRFDTRLMEVTGGRLVSKGGAEGFQGIGIQQGALYPGSPALGVAIKIADGDTANRAGAAVVVEVLRQIGAITDSEAGEVLPDEKKIVRNSRGLSVGELIPVFQLQGNVREI